MHFILRTILGQLRELTLSRPIVDILNVCARTNDWRLHVCANDTKCNGNFYAELLQFFGKYLRKIELTSVQDLFIFC